jgi:Protein of unknown function (DUF2591)
MKYFVSDLSGELLDRAVALSVSVAIGDLFDCTDDVFMPSEFWEDAGPLIERFCLYLHPVFLSGLTVLSHWESGSWAASTPGFVAAQKRGSTVYARGATPLEAAMRTVVANVLGEEIDIPSTQE